MPGVQLLFLSDRRGGGGGRQQPGAELGRVEPDGQGNL